MTRFKIPGILKSNLHFFWIILFFIINGYNDQTQNIPLTDLVILFLILSSMSAFFFWFFVKWYRSRLKAGVLISIILILVLFFGVFQDSIASVRSITALARFPVLISIVFFLITLVAIFLKYTNRIRNKASLFLNALFQVYVLVELLTLLQGVLFKPQNAYSGAGTTSCRKCARPNVYLIILDEYFGSTGLLQYYRYDNSGFEGFLKHRGFTVLSGTRSNYSLTVFSMSSMFNMHYLQGIGEISLKNHFAYTTAMSGIESNSVINKFRAEGYRIDNKSQFHMRDAPSNYSTGLLPAKVQFINSKTLYYRVGKYLPVYLANKWNITWFAQRIDEKAIARNQQILDVALEEASRIDTTPTFTYMHLSMPHEPLAFDSTGKPMIPFWKRKGYSRQDADEAYLQYLVYTNKKIGDYVDKLLNATKGKAVILLMSDHGYRGAVHKGYKDIFQTLNAVYVPGKTTSEWYDGMTNVNQFRVLFNTLFNAGWPLLKDSVSR